MEQNLNINKKFDNEEDKSLEYKDNQKFINWIDIYKKGYNKPYIIFIIIIVIIDYVVFGFLYGLWKRYESQSILTFDLIHDSWDFERLTLTIINYYHHMIFMNQTLDDISNNYFHENNNSCIENFLIILTKYNKLRKKIDNTDIIKSYNELCEYNCQSLYDFIVVVNSVTTLFQGFYQKCFNEMITLTDRTYEGLINKLFNSHLPNLTSTFFNVIRYIIYIIGKVAYSESFEKILEILEKVIVISLILYISVEILFIIFIFIYIWNINIESRNMFILKHVFEVTNINDV